MAKEKEIASELPGSTTSKTTAYKEIASELPGSTTSKTTAYEVGGYYHIEGVLFRIRAEVIAVHDDEIVVQPFRFDEPKMIRYHNGLSEPFMGEMIIAKATIVRASVWVPQ